MNRLTERFSNGQAAVYGCGSNCKYEFKYCNKHLEDCPTINEIYERLAQYEEIGTVECFKNALKNVRTLSNMYEKLRDQEVAEFHKLAEYEDLEEQGKLLKLPCAVGDTVYTNVSMQGWYFRKKNRPYEAKIVFVGINGADNYINVDFRDGYMIQFKFTDIGKTVFLTREEAEAALKGLLTSKQP